MSYILDALRKSEQQRLAGSVPGLDSGQPAPVETAAPHRNWLALAIVLLVINIGAIGWWLAMRLTAPTHPPASPELAPALNRVQPAGPSPATQALPAPGPVPATAAVQAPPPSTVQPSAATPPPQQVPERARQDQPPAARPSRPEAPSASRDSMPSSPRPAIQSVSPAAAAIPPAEADGIPAAPPRGIVAYADLPPAVRNALPPLKIGGYVDGADGAMLVVDDRLVREGDEFGPGVRLLKISPDGGVFGFRNYRFRR